MSGVGSGQPLSGGSLGTIYGEQEEILWVPFPSRHQAWDSRFPSSIMAWTLSLPASLPASLILMFPGPGQGPPSIAVPSKYFSTLGDQ